MASSSSRGAAAPLFTFPDRSWGHSELEDPADEENRSSSPGPYRRRFDRAQQSAMLSAHPISPGAVREPSEP